METYEQHYASMRATIEAHMPGADMQLLFDRRCTYVGRHATSYSTHLGWKDILHTMHKKLVQRQCIDAFLVAIN